MVRDRLRSERPTTRPSLVRQLRERAGLSLREVARRAEIAPATLHALETDGGGRHETLAAILRVVPGLAARDLWELPPEWPLPSSEALWDWAVTAHGVVADRVTVRPRSVRVDGLQAVDADPDDPAVRLALMRVACRAPVSVLRQLEPETTRFEQEGIEHQWTWRSGRLDYQRSGPVNELAFLVDFPTQELLLRGVSTNRGWARALSPVSEERDLMAALHPTGIERLRAGCRITRPVVGLRYETTTEPQPAHLGLPTLGAQARALRVERGMSQEQLAATSGLPLSTISDIEATSGNRATTTRKLPAVFGVSPQELLPGPLAESECSDADAWDWYRELHGLECDEIIKTVEIDERGFHSTSIRTLGLRSTRRAGADLAMMIPSIRAAAQLSPAILECLKADAAAGATRSSHEADGLRLTVDMSDTGDGRANLLREYAPAWFSAMTEAAAMKRFKVPSPVSEGVGLTSLFATLRLRLVVELPSEYEPRSWSGHSWPAAMAASTDYSPRAPVLIRVEREGSRTSLTATISRPLPGFQFGVAWVLP